jgi:hypothetical protein
MQCQWKSIPNWLSKILLFIFATDQHKFTKNDYHNHLVSHEGFWQVSYDTKKGERKICERRKL